MWSRILLWLFTINLGIAYFIPTMVWLMRQPDTLAAVRTATVPFEPSRW